MWWQGLTHRIASALPLASGLTTKAKGDAAEDLALAHAKAHGMTLLARQFKTPGRGGGEVDLILRTACGTLVFVEVRARANHAAGGAAASVSPQKQRRITLAAQHYLRRQRGPLPPCRFDVCAVTAGQIEWIEAAFDARL
jgi:putative endonuclease